MDTREFLPALCAFKAGQEGLLRVLFGRRPVGDAVAEGIDGLARLLDVG